MGETPIPVEFIQWAYSERGKLIRRQANGEQVPPHEIFLFTRFGTLELARDHTWANLCADPTATLLFYQPPRVSYELRGKVEIHEDGSPYHRLLNAQHDVYHRPDPSRWKDRPAYIFVIEEIYNNSAAPDGFGRKIYPV